MKIAIRADSSENIGTGHIVRCICLAKELRKLGAQIYFISKSYKGNILQLVKKNKFFTNKINPKLSIKKDISETSKILKKNKIDSLILDNYDLNLIWEKKIKKKVKKLIVISDFKKKHCCDILINFNVLAGAKKSINSFYPRNLITSSKLLLGLKYAILSNKYQSLKKKLKPKKKLKRVNVFFGGFKGSSNLLENVIDVLSNKIFKKIKIDIVVGLNQNISKKINLKLNKCSNFKIFKNLPDLSNLFKKTDLAIGSGGTANLERLCLGIPSLVFVAAKNQEMLANILEKKKLIIKLKNKNNQIDKNYLFNLINKFHLNKNLLKQFFEKTKLIIDGFGSRRVARAVIGFKNSYFKIRKVNKEDANILFDMANDTVVRKNAFNQKLISYENHLKWFDLKLKNSGTHMYLAEDSNGLAIGQIRFDYDSKEKKYYIDISIDEFARGHGIGKIFLKKVLNDIRYKKIKNKNFLAKVLNRNVASHKLFLDCNFYKIKKHNKFTLYGYNTN